MPERYLGRSLGKYRVAALLGTGGFAWVYRAHDPDLDVTVALKVLKPQYAGDPEFVARFRREASTAARLRHPNIITIYAVGSEDDAAYFAMDYLPQGLSGRLEVTPTLPGPVLVRLAVDVASALGFAHRQGVVHRDIKPDNILFDEHGNAIVADFGIARALAGATKDTATQMVVGTPHYFAPEQARGRTLDGRADLYALGVTLYRAASGALPFPGEDWYAVARAHVEDEPADVRSHGVALSGEMAAVIHRLLEKEPDDRFQDAEELCAALALVPERGEQSTSTMRTITMPVLDRLWTTSGITVRRRRLRRRVLWTTGGLVAALLAVAAVTSNRTPVSGGSPADSSVSGAPADGIGTPGSPPRLGTVTVLAPPADVDSVSGPEVRPPTLRLAAPDGARLLVDGRPVGEGSWAGRNLRPGTHVIAAEVATVPGCAEARVERRVTLVAGRTERVELAPRACGLLTVLPRVGGNPLPPDAGGRYTVSDAEGSVVRTGKLPLTDPLVLPAGRYDVRVDNVPLCSQFSGSVDVAAGEKVTPRIFLLCER
ncbi:MAG: serine/threonine-protein kinase [Gemmatimonadaceae bacterium]